MKKECSTKDSATKDSSTKDDSTVDSSIKGDSTVDSSIKDDSTIDSSIKDDSTIDSSIKGDSTVDNNKKKSENYKFFNHRECEYFPCHKVEDDRDFNCLFCFCPLYALGSRCGGNYRYTESGIKDCSNCILPHKKENYSYIMSKYKEIKEIAEKNR